MELWIKKSQVITKWLLNVTLYCTKYFVGLISVHTGSWIWSEFVHYIRISIGADLISGPSLTSKEIIIKKIRRCRDRHMFVMGIPSLARWCSYIESLSVIFGPNKSKIKIFSVNCDLLNSLLVKSKPYCYTTFNLLYYHMQKELYTFGISCKRRWQWYH